MSIKNSCQKKYFYGKNLQIERGIGSLESLHIRILNSINTTKKLPEGEDYFDFLRLIAFQRARTLKRKEYTNHWVDKFGKHVAIPAMLLKEPRLKKKFTPEYLENISLSWGGMFLYQMALSWHSDILLRDLTPVLLLNKTNNNFIYSDSPVVYYNLYYWNVEPGHLGLQSPGLLIFYPLSNRTSLILYDNNFYQIKTSKNILKIRTLADIDAINTLQFFNCFDNVFFVNESQAQNLRKLFGKWQASIHKNNKSLLCIKEFNADAEGVSKFVNFSPVNIKYELNASFIKIKRKIPQSHHRDEQLVKQYDEAVKHLNDIVAK